MTVTDIHPDEAARAAEAFARLQEIRAEHLVVPVAVPAGIVEDHDLLASIRAQAGLPPAPARPVTPRPELGPVDPWEAELHRREITRRRQAAEAGKPYRGCTSRKLIPTPLPVPVRCWWPVRPPSCRAAVRRPLNAARRAVVATWPVADQRDHARAATTLLWALGTLVAAAGAVVVVIAAVVLLAVLRAPLRVWRWRQARRQPVQHHTQPGPVFPTPVASPGYHPVTPLTWTHTWEPAPAPAPVTYRRRRTLTPLGTAVMLAVFAVGWMLMLGIIISAGTTRLERDRAERAELTGEVQP